MRQLKDNTEAECGKVALLFGLAAQNSNDPGFNAAVARRYNVMPELVAALPEEYRQRLAAENARDALTCAPVLRTMVAEKPYMASIVGDDVKNTAAIEQALNDIKSAHPAPDSPALFLGDHPLLGGYETELNLATGLLTSPIAIGMGGLGLLAKAFSSYPEGSEEARNAGIDPAKLMAGTQEALSYSPRTQSGKIGAQWLSDIMSWPGAKAGHGVADLAEGMGASTDTAAAMGATTNAIVDMVPALLGLGRRSKAPATARDDAPIGTQPATGDKPPAPVTAPDADKSKAAKAIVADAPQINDLSDKLAAPKWRDHPAFPDYVDNAATKAGQPEIHLDANGLQQFIAKHNIAPDEMPEVFAALKDAAANGKDVVSLPTGTYAKYLADKKELRQWVTLHPDDMSLARAKEHLADVKRQVDGRAGQTKNAGEQPDRSAEAPIEEVPAGARVHQDAQDAEALHNKLLQLDTLKSRATDPAQFSQELNRLTTSDPAKGFYVNARVLRGLLRKGKVKDADIQANAPQLASDIASAIEHNGGVFVPFDALANHFAGKLNDLFPNARPTPGKPGHAEAQAALNGEPNPAENHGNTGAESWGNTHPPLLPEQVQVPGGGLRAHEAMGGHALEKHAGKTEPELADRNIKEPNIPASSSFFNEAIAEEAIAAALKAKDPEIRAWLASGGKGPAPDISITMSKPIGITMPQGATVAQPAYGAQVGIRRDALSPLGYYIITGFPK